MNDTRLIAARVIAGLQQGRGSLSRLLPWAEPQVGSRDRALLRELCYGTARKAPRLQLILDKLLRKPLKDDSGVLPALLLIGLYQLEYTRIPNHAAISATVEAGRSLRQTHATGLINGVLRNALRNREQLTRKLSGNPQFSSAHPIWLQQAIKQSWGDAAKQILSANNSNPPMTLRVNTIKSSRDDYLQQLNKANIVANPCRFSTVGIQLEQAVAVTQLPGFDDGLVSVQDESAQMAAQLLQPQAGDRVLDACAAPGGKTCHLLEQQANLQLVALDIEEQRLQRINDNLTRIGADAHVMCADAANPQSWWDGKPFDHILLDAPCSATGVIRRNPDIKLLRRQEDITELAKLQYKIIRALWPLLRPGGTLLYATCSIMPQENTQLMSRFIAEYKDASDNTPQYWHGEPWAKQQAAGMQILPEVGGGDGFYYTLLNKTG
ncbi:MAG: 16S rRNA (cytosine(967)-C(5))-methyltransferase RsmB [Gammaproteobacteria bacterium]|nr:16S rRNA (cytosine(967)-C(5))-methyltransferase RsmB [Gammaproteobacteria bacterium]